MRGRRVHQPEIRTRMVRRRRSRRNSLDTMMSGAEAVGEEAEDIVTMQAAATAVVIHMDDRLDKDKDRAYPVVREGIDDDKYGSKLTISFCLSVLADFYFILFCFIHIVSFFFLAEDFILSVSVGLLELQSQ